MKAEPRDTPAIRGRVHVRMADDDRLHVAIIDQDISVSALDLVAVSDRTGVVRPARIAGRIGSLGEPDADELRVVARYNVNMGAMARIADPCICERRPESEAGAHRWGALGLPAGPETRVSAEAVGARSDFDAAIQSAGYREVVQSRYHQLVPGDRCRIDGNDVTIKAIDRRRNEIELEACDNQASQKMPLDAFIEGEKRA